MSGLIIVANNLLPNKINIKNWRESNKLNLMHTKQSEVHHKIYSNTEAYVYVSILLYSHVHFVFLMFVYVFCYLYINKFLNRYLAVKVCFKSLTRDLPCLSTIHQREPLYHLSTRSLWHDMALPTSWSWTISQISLKVYYRFCSRFKRMICYD